MSKREDFIKDFAALLVKHNVDEFFTGVYCGRDQGRFGYNKLDNRCFARFIIDRNGDHIVIDSEELVEEALKNYEKKD